MLAVAAAVGDIPDAGVFHVAVAAAAVVGIAHILSSVWWGVVDMTPSDKMPIPADKIPTFHALILFFYIFYLHFE